MTAVTFGGVSPRSLGDLLKGYGVIAVVGKDFPETLFSWDDAFHLVVERPCDANQHLDKAKPEIEKLLCDRLTAWGTSVAEQFRPRRGEKCGQRLPPAAIMVIQVRRRGKLLAKRALCCSGHADSTTSWIQSRLFGGVVSRCRCPNRAAHDQRASGGTRLNLTHCFPRMVRRVVATTSRRSIRQ